MWIIESRNKHLQTNSRSNKSHFVASRPANTFFKTRKLVRRMRRTKCKLFKHERKLQRPEHRSGDNGNSKKKQCAGVREAGSRNYAPHHLLYLHRIFHELSRDNADLSELYVHLISNAMLLMSDKIWDV